MNRFGLVFLAGLCLCLGITSQKMNLLGSSEGLVFEEKARLDVRR